MSRIRTLDRYAWTGHSALVGTVARPWQATQPILAQFGPPRRRAIRAYRAFIAAEIPQGRRPALQGGGLIRSAGGWAAVSALRRGREAYVGDERILGTPEFVEAVRAAIPAPRGTARRPVPLARILTAVATAAGLAPDALGGDGRAARLARAREGAAYLWCRRAGYAGRALAAALGVSHQAVSAAATRGERLAARWDRVWERLR